VTVLARVLNRISPAGHRGRLSILIFHRVLSRPDDLLPDIPDTAAFDRIVTWLTSWFNIIPLDRAVALLAASALPERAAAITFDDGYADNYRVALPVLRRHGVCATFFIATGYLDGGRMWNDTVIETVRSCTQPVLDLGELGLGRHAVSSIDERRGAVNDIIGRLKYLPFAERLQRCEAIGRSAGCSLPDDLMMTTADVVALRNAGMQIGAHTVSHPILARLGDDEARAEIADSRRSLESILREPVTLFAYPNGKPDVDYLPAHVDMVRQLGFGLAVSTVAGVATTESDPMELPRFTPWERDRIRFGMRMASNLRRPVQRRLAAV
jgi:peptidoglycan/xylan/chitin deacetylase (PgdA/CDA1 family)